MNLTEEFLHVGKEKATRIKSFLEELEVQMALGKAEARDAFENEKKSLNRFLNNYKAQVKQGDDIATEHRMELDQKFAALDALVSQEFPTAKRKYDQFKKNTLQAIHELEFSLKEAYGDVGFQIREKLDRFKDQLDAYRIQLALSDYQPEETLLARKTELMEAVGVIRTKLQSEMEAGSKMEHFVDDISDSFDKMKKAFSDLFA